MRLLTIALLVGCGTDSGVAENPPDASVGQSESQLPPQGHTALKAWLADGSYRSWTCVVAPHAARPPGAHGSNRICSNGVLSATTTGTFPAGAASVKELWRDGKVTGYAVGVKLTDSADVGSWYWYEAVGDSIYADGTNVGLCTGCHSGASRDYVFTQVR